jgi:hypothetical protein
MFYQNLDNIKTELLIDEATVQRADGIFLKLKPSDTLTTGVFSRKTGLSFDQSETFLIKCVEFRILDIQILVFCEEDPEEHRPLVFNSLNEFRKAYVESELYECPFCGGEYNFNDAVIAFKRPSKNKRVGL